MARAPRRHVALLATAIMIALAGPLHAAEWPTKPVTVIVPFGAGGNTDMMARLAAQHLSTKFGQSFVIENRPSAGGALGTGQVATATPDAYTLLFAASSMIVLTPQLQNLELILSAIRNEVGALARSPEISDRLTKLGIIPGGLTKEQSEAVFKHDFESFAAAIKAARIEPSR